MREHNIQNIAHLSYYTNANGLLLVVLIKRGSAKFSLALACGLARATVWCGVARLLPRVAAVRPPSCSLDAGCAGGYAGARHGVVRGGAWAAEGGGCEPAVVLARRRLRWLVGWRAPRCGAG